MSHSRIGRDIIRHYDIFISYSSQDGKYANLLREKLERGKYRVWYDNQEIRLGDNLLEKIEEGLRNAYYGIVILSRHYLNFSPWTDFEFRHILISGNIFIITHMITLDEIRNEYRLVYTDIRRRLGISSESGLDNVFDEVNKVVRDSIINQRPEFAQFREFLAARDWKRADIETYNLVHPNHGLLRLPHKDFDILNRLWFMYSEGNYGFSTQREIYKKKYNQSRDYLQSYKEFCTSVVWGSGWNAWIETLNYDSCANTHKGHYPALVYFEKELREYTPLNSASFETIRYLYQKRLEYLVGFFLVLYVFRILLFLAIIALVIGGALALLKAESFGQSFSFGLAFPWLVALLALLWVVELLFRRLNSAERLRICILHEFFNKENFWR